MRKLTVGTENIQLLEMLRTKCFQSHENYWLKEAFIPSVIMDSRQRFPALEVKIKLSAMPLEGIALSVVSFFLFAGAASTKNCTEHCYHKSAPLEWGVTSWAAYTPLEFLAEAAQIHCAAGQGPSALGFSPHITEIGGQLVANLGSVNWWFSFKDESCKNEKILMGIKNRNKKIKTWWEWK